MAVSGDHRRVPPPDLLIAAAAELANVPIVHYDRDYECIAAITDQEHAWFVQDGPVELPWRWPGRSGSRPMTLRSGVWLLLALP